MWRDEIVRAVERGIGGLPRAEDVNVIVHEHVGMHRQPESPRGFDQAPVEVHPIAFRPEDGLAVIPALHKINWSLTPFILVPLLLAGCSLLDPYNMIGRQQGPEGTSVA